MVAMNFRRIAGIAAVIKITMRSKMKWGIWLTLVMAINVIVATVSQAQTNSCVSSTGGFWQAAQLWSLAETPSIAQDAILITNAASVIITIDSVTAERFTSMLTISNLNVSPPSGGTDALYLNNTRTIALHILDSLTIGINPASPYGEGALICTNSTLIVDGLLGGQLLDNGTMAIMGGALITTNCSLQVAASSYPASGILIVSNGVVQARDVTVASGNSSSGAIDVLGGTMTLSSFLSVGDGLENSLSSLLVANGGLLVVTNNETDIGGSYESSGNLTVSNASFLGADVFLGGARSDGELMINNGTVTVSGQLGIGDSEQGSGTVSLNGGQLVVTNGATRLGVGTPSSGSVAISDGLFLARDVYVGAYESSGAFLINGGTSILSSNLQIGVGNSEATVSVTGGQLIVTNAAGTGFIDVRNGQLILGGGVLQVDKLVMTNSGSGFIHTGGALVVGSVVLDPNAFRITSIAREGNDLRVTWMMGPGQTNALQATSGGTYADIFIVANNTTPGFVTNYLDVGAATNTPSRFYRARLTP